MVGGGHKRHRHNQGPAKVSRCRCRPQKVKQRSEGETEEGHISACGHRRQKITTPTSEPKLPTSATRARQEAHSELTLFVGTCPSLHGWVPGLAARNWPAGANFDFRKISSGGVFRWSFFSPPGVKITGKLKGTALGGIPPVAARRRHPGFPLFRA